MTSKHVSDPVIALKALEAELVAANQRLERIRKRTQVLLSLAVVCLVLSLACSISGRPDWVKVAPVFSPLGSALGFAGWWFGRVRSLA